MKRYHIFSVKISEIEFLAKVNSENLESFISWANNTPSIKQYVEHQSVNRIAPHTKNKYQSKITQARIASGITQRELADGLGVSIAQAQRWEYGKHKPRASTLKRIGEILGVDWTTLVEDE